MRPRSGVWPGRVRRLLMLVLALLGLLGVLAAQRTWSWVQDADDGLQPLALLLPDAQALAHPVTRAWLQVAREEGVPLTPMLADEFLHRMANGQRLAGVVLPDTVHTRASDLLVSQLYRHVDEGGQLLLAFDAAVHQPQRGVYTPGQSRLSQLVGVRYALYQQLGEATTAVDTVQASRQAEAWLGLQPGKLDFSVDPQGQWGELTTYAYAALDYSHYRTGVQVQAPGQLPAQVLMRAADGDPVLTLRRHGQGQVLWANLPLGYLKTRTDGYLLHRLLPTWARTLLHWPVLSPVPDGVGGLVLNLHVDSNAAQAPMAVLEREGWFDQGPMSIHITAGPDAIRMHDRTGLDLPRNQELHALLRRLQSRGHELGSHGGWIHNVFGYGVGEDNERRFMPWLVLNHEAVSAVRDAPVQVYSAPMGNQPRWVTNWLRRENFHAYYTTSDNGVGPTRAFEQGQAAPRSQLWSFPVSSFGRLATLDELPLRDLPQAPFAAFMTDLMAYTAEAGVVRLTYFHPATAMTYRATLEAIARQAQALSASGRFRFYSMQALAEFLSRREQVAWQLHDSAGGQRSLQARACCALAGPHTPASSLAGMTWLLERTQAARPQVLEGQARIEEDPRHWRVIATGGARLHIQWSPS
jgi:hypothetical protein